MSGGLFRSDDSVLVVVDAQPGFLDKVPGAQAHAVVDRISWLVRAATCLGVPVVVTEEEPARHGTTAEAIADALPDGTERHLKASFGLADNPGLLEVLHSTAGADRRAAVLCGLETDVCVAQSALGLHAAGWNVGVVCDAVAAPGTAHEQGLARMRDAGVALVGCKGLFYEWVGSVDRLGLVAECRSRPPQGIVL